MPMSLTLEPSKTLSGLTFFSDDSLGHWARPTGIYVPPGVDIDKGVVNVLLYLHGWFVPKIEQLFYADRAAVRQQVLASGKNVILVAPWLGHGHRGGGSTYNARDLKGHWGELYLNQVLGALAVGRDPEKFDAPWRRKDLFQVASPGLNIGRLIIACHSGGGEAMRNLVGSLGRYRWNLRECWGFDCLYGAKAEPDDAGFWYNWVTGSDGHPLYVSNGSSTVPQSVKLYLMGRGLATDQGARRNPVGPVVERLHVTLGISSAQSVETLMGVDKLPPATTPKPKPTPADTKFAAQAASNLLKHAGWPGDLMEMHYRIAKDGLLDRLKAATFL